MPLGTLQMKREGKRPLQSQLCNCLKRQNLRNQTNSASKINAKTRPKNIATRNSKSAISSQQLTLKRLSRNRQAGSGKLINQSAGVLIKMTANTNGKMTSQPTNNDILSLLLIRQSPLPKRQYLPQQYELQGAILNAHLKVGSQPPCQEQCNRG